MRQIAPDPLAPEITGLWDKLKGFPCCHITRWWPAWTWNQPIVLSNLCCDFAGGDLASPFTPHFIRRAVRASSWWQTGRVTWPIPCHSSTNKHPWYLTEVSAGDVGLAPLNCHTVMETSYWSTGWIFSRYKCGISWVSPCWAQGIKKTPVGHLLWVVSDGYVLLRHL